MMRNKWSAVLRRLQQNLPLVVLCVVAALFVAVIGLGRLTHNALVTKATTHQPERFTELYFTDPTNLPSTATPGQDIPVKFVMHNMEYQSMTYTYCVRITGGSDDTCPAQYHITLQQNETQAITANVVVPAGTGRSEVNVDLLSKHQSIHFWLERQHT
jgi:hypothetical protein